MLLPLQSWHSRYGRPAHDWIAVLLMHQIPAVERQGVCRVHLLFIPAQSLAELGVGCGNISVSHSTLSLYCPHVAPCALPGNDVRPSRHVILSHNTTGSFDKGCQREACTPKQSEDLWPISGIF